MDAKTIAYLKLALGLPAFLKHVDNAELKDLAQKLSDALKPELPTHADGSPIEESEIQAVLDRAQAHDDAILDSRRSDGQDEGT